MGQAQRGGREQERRRGDVPAPREDVDDDRGGVDALVEGLATGGLDGGQPIGGNAAQDLHHLPVAVVRALQLAPDCRHRRRKHPVAEGRSVPEGPGLARQDRHVVPGVVHGLPSSKGPSVLAHDSTVLPDDDPLGIGVWTSTGRPTAVAITEYLLLSKRTVQVLETEAGTARGSRQRGRRSAPDAGARPRTSPRRFCRSPRGGDGPWRGPRTCRAARRSTRRGS